MLVHKHLIVRAEVMKPPTDPDLLTEWMRELVAAIGMKIVGGPHVYYVDKEGNKGLTGCVIIETSHCAIHVWDEGLPALIQFDVYSCSDFKLNTVFDFLSEFQPVKVDWKFLDREHNLIEEAIN